MFAESKSQKPKKTKTKQYFLHIYIHTHVCIYINYIHTCESRVLTPTMQWLLQLLPCVITDALSTVSSVVHSSPTPICFCHESCAQAVQRGVTIRGAPRLCTITARTDLSLAKTCLLQLSTHSAKHADSDWTGLAAWISAQTAGKTLSARRWQLLHTLIFSSITAEQHV